MPYPVPFHSLARVPPNNPGQVSSDLASSLDNAFDGMQIICLV